MNREDVQAVQQLCIAEYRRKLQQKGLTIDTVSVDGSAHDAVLELKVRAIEPMDIDTARHLMQEIFGNVQDERNGSVCFRTTYHDAPLYAEYLGGIDVARRD